MERTLRRRHARSDEQALDEREVRELYRRRARRYDVTSRLYELLGYRLDAYRREGVEALALKPGDTVVEIGCGTGANFEQLEEAVGPEGRIIAVDLTDAMLRQARARARRHGWHNVEFVEADAARFEFPEGVAGVFSSYALTLVEGYDAVVRNAAAALRPAGRMVVVDFKAPEGWPPWLLRAILPLLRPFGVELPLTERHPWESVARHLRLVSMKEHYLGTTYVAVGEAG